MGSVWDAHTKISPTSSERNFEYIWMIIWRMTDETDLDSIGNFSALLISEFLLNNAWLGQYG